MRIASCIIDCSSSSNGENKAERAERLGGLHDDQLDD